MRKKLPRYALQKRFPTLAFKIFQKYARKNFTEDKPVSRYFSLTLTKVGSTNNTEIIFSKYIFFDKLITLLSLIKASKLTEDEHIHTYISSLWRKIPKLYLRPCQTSKINQFLQKLEVALSWYLFSL